MLPLLFPGTPFEVPTYFVLLLLAALGAILAGIYKAKSFGLKAYRAVDIGFIGFVSGLVGGRLTHILVEAPAYYWEHPARVLYFWQGGFVLYGGLIGGVLGGCLAARFFKEPIVQWIDVAAIPLLVGISIGRVGCLAGGCCYGQPTDSFWGMVFTHPLSSAPLHQSLYPTQLFEIVFCASMALILWFWFPRPPRKQGTMFAIAALSYAIFRFLVEFIRGDQERGVYGSAAISTSQIISIVVVLGVLLFFWQSSRLRRDFSK